jgi:hypothetical protein
MILAWFFNKPLLLPALSFPDYLANCEKSDRTKRSDRICQQADFLASHPILASYSFHSHEHNIDNAYPANHVYMREGFGAAVIADMAARGMVTVIFRHCACHE